MPDWIPPRDSLESLRRIEMMAQEQLEQMDMDYLRDVHDLIRVRNRPSFVSPVLFNKSLLYV